MKKNTILFVILIVLTVLALASIAADGGRKFTTTLTGAAEVPGPGDPDGSGTAMLELNPGTGQVCWEIQVSDITLPAIAAHIHKAPVGVAGPVVVPLFPPVPDESGFSSGCMNADRELIKDIIQHPEGYYVNVHTTDFPAGAVRGQLSK
jgi:CHRD domain